MDGSGNSGKRKNSYTPNEGCLVFFKAKTCSAGACHNPGLYTTCGHLIKPRTVFIQSKGELPNVASSYAADPVTIFSQHPKSPALLSPAKGRFIFPVLSAVQSPSDEVVNDSRRARYTLHTLPGSDCDNYGTPPSAHYFHHQGTLKPVYKHGQCRSAFSLAGIKENEMSSGFRGRELAPNTVHDKGIEMIQFPRKESLSERNWGNLAQHRGHRPRFQQQFDIKQPAEQHLPSTGHRSDSQEVCPKMVEALEDSFSACMGTTFQQREMKESNKGAPDQLTRPSGSETIRSLRAQEFSISYISFKSRKEDSFMVPATYWYVIRFYERHGTFQQNRKGDIKRSAQKSLSATHSATLRSLSVTFQAAFCYDQRNVR